MLDHVRQGLQGGRHRSSLGIPPHHAPHNPGHQEEGQQRPSEPPGLAAHRKFSRNRFFRWNRGFGGLGLRFWRGQLFFGDCFGPGGFCSLRSCFGPLRLRGGGGRSLLRGLLIRRALRLLCHRRLPVRSHHLPLTGYPEDVLATGTTEPSGGSGNAVFFQTEPGAAFRTCDHHNSNHLKSFNKFINFLCYLTWRPEVKSIFVPR